MNMRNLYSTDMIFQKFRTSFLQNVYVKIYQNKVRYCTPQNSVSEEEKQKEIERITRNASIDDPPTACCRTGCANCVFIVWAEALAEKMQDAGPEITNKVLKMVDDPSLKAYLEMELRLRLKKQH